MNFISNQLKMVMGAMTQWWGIASSYIIIFVSFYIYGWQFIEPLNLDLHPIFYVLAISWFSAHITLIIIFFLNFRLRNRFSHSLIEPHILGKWYGMYLHDVKQRTVTLNLKQNGDQLIAESITETQEGNVIQKFKVSDLEFRFQLKSESIELSPNRTKKWLPETWLCFFSLTSHDILGIRIEDANSSGNNRIIAETKLRKLPK